MAKAQWDDVVALTKPIFDSGYTPDRNELMDLAYAKDANDDVIDAIDTLGGRPVASLEQLKELLTNNGALA
ncbi:MAG: hypothetical protein ACSLFM_10870 [Tepidiformaceae bacterium]